MYMRICACKRLYVCICNIGFISNNKDIINKAMKNIAPILEERNLNINEKETIQHTINRTKK